MRKNVLVSILAVASASTMTAYANANLNQIKTDAATDWTDDSSVTLTDGVIVSPNGIAVSQNIGKLLPGSYKLSATTENAKITVNGKELDAQGRFSLTAETEVEIKIEADVTGRQYTVGGLTLELVFDFEDARTTLTAALAEVTNKIYAGDDAGKALTDRASEIAADIAKLANDADGEYAAYDIYKKYELYKGVEGSTIMAAINTLETDVDAATGNSEPYYAAVDVIDGMADALKTAKAAIAAITDEGTKEYANTVTASAYSAANTYIEAYRAEAKAAYEAGTAGSVCTSVRNAEFAKEAQRLVDAYEAAIDQAKLDHPAYVEVSAKVAELKTQYNAATQEIYNNLQDDEQHPGVFADLRTEAQTALNEVNTNIMVVEKDNGTADNHVGAADIKDANLEKLTGYGSQIESIVAQYVGKANALKKAYKDATEDAKSLQDRLNKIAKAGDVAQKHADAIADIQALIDAFKAKIEKDYTDNTIDSKNYTSDKNAISGALDTLTADAQPDIDNYNAYANVQTAVAEVQALLDEAMAAVNALKSEDGKYVVDGKYNAEESALSAELAKYLSGAETAYKAGTCVAYETANSGKITAVGTKVADYQANAEDALAAYETIIEQTTAYSAAIKALEKKVDNRSVTVYAQPGKTYGALIDEYNATVTKITNAKNNALKLTGTDHSEALFKAAKMTEGVTIVADAETLVASYDADKAQYDKDVVNNAVDRMLARAQELVDDAQTMLDAHKPTQSALGLSYNKIKDEFDRLQSAVDGQKGEITAAETNADKTAAMAALTTIQSHLVTITEDINAMIAASNEAKAKVKANNAANTNAEEVIAGIRLQLNGDAETAVLGVADLNEDPNRTAEFAKIVSDIESAIAAQETAIANAHAKETLTAAWEDTTAGDGTVTEGIKTKLDGIMADVTEARALAEASTDNYDAYQGILKYIGELKIAANIDAATAAVAEVTSGTGATYYNNLIATYDKNFASLQSQADKAYNGRTCTSSAENIKSQLKTLNDNIKAVGPNAEANQKAYDGQTVLYNTVDELFNETYYAISTGDQTSAVQGYLEQLTAQQLLLTAVNQDIATYFGKGQSDAKNADITGRLNDINAAIKAIAETQNENYSAAVAADNATRFAAFQAAVADVRAAYSDALDLIDQYNALTNAELTEVSVPAVIAANTEINGILAELRTLENQVTKEYNATLSPELFDETESYKATVESYVSKISETLETLDNTVSDKARELYEAAYPAAQQKLDDAIATLNAQGYNAKVVGRAFTDVRKIIKDAANAAKGENFALSVDSYLNAFNTVDDLLVAGKEAAAADEWNTVITAVDKQVAEERADLALYEYIGDTDGSTKQYYIDEYEKLVAETVDEAKAAYAKVKEGNRFASLPAVKAYLDGFYASTIYSRATVASQNQEANQAAYDAIVATLDDLQAALDAAGNFVGAYVITDECGVSNAQTAIDGLRSDMDDQLAWGGCVSFNADNESRCAAIDAQIASIYVLANNKEQARIDAEIESLKGDQNKAANATVGDDAKSAEVEAYTEVIAALGESFTEMISSEEFMVLDEKDKQAKYLDFEKQIAEIRAELAVYYDSSLGETTYKALTDALAEVETGLAKEVEDLAACHADVKAEYNSQLAALGDVVAEVKAAIDNRNAEGSILFYEDKLSKGISDAAATLAELSEAIDKAQAPYTANDNAYQKLSAQVSGLTAKLDALVEKISGYTYVYVADEMWQERITEIRELIQEAQEDLNSKHADIKLTASSTVSGKSTIESLIASLDVDATYDELNTGIYVTGVSPLSLRGQYNEVSNVIRSSKYTAEKSNELYSRLSSLFSQIMYLRYYNNYSHDGFISQDIDGNIIENEDGTIGKSINYISEAVPEIQAKMVELSEAIAELAVDAEEYAYILGDVDRDGYVRVNDFTKIMDYVLERDIVEEGSMEWLAADVNEDGKVNIGDITSVTNLINGVTTTRTLNAPAKVYAASTTVVAADALRLTAEEVDGVQRIAVRIDASRAYVGCQLDVKLPVGATLLGEQLGDLATDHELYSNTLADGTHRIVIASMDNSALAAGGEVLVYIDVAGRLANRTTVADVLLTDAAGTMYSVAGGGNDGTTGIEGVNAEMTVKEKIYSVGGQLMDTIKKGVNIIRKSDGSVKKVIRK